MSFLHLDAEALYSDLLTGVRGLLRPGTALVGIWSGGAWLAERLQRELLLDGEHGVISSALHRDDFSSRGMTAGADHTRLPFEIEGRHILLVDDVLFTGRTIRAVVNELFDFGRPASVYPGGAGRSRRARAADRAAYSAARITLPAHQRCHWYAMTLAVSASTSGSARFEFQTQPSAQQARRADPSAVD
jgi:pyrimidine operon attenuation protein / uracil phosphoribosyltransferase